MTEQKRNLLMPTLAIIALSLLWGSAFTIVKNALDYYHVFWVTFIRLALAAAMFGLFWNKIRRVKVLKSDIPILAVMVLCEPCLFFSFEAYALVYTTASQAGMIVALNPVLMAAVALVFLRERPSPQALLGFAVAVVGVLVLSHNSEVTESAPNPVLGNILEILSLSMGAIFLVCIKRLKGLYPAIFIAALQTSLGSVFFLGMLFMPGVPVPEAWPLAPTLSVVFMGVIGTFTGFMLYNYGLRNLPATRTAGLLNLVPVFAVASGVLFLGEQLTPIQWGACAMVILGVIVSQRPPREKKKAAEIKIGDPQTCKG